MNRYSVIRGTRPDDHMELSGWLIIDSAGAMRMVRGRPDTGRDEVAVALNVQLPMSLFRKPLLRASVTVPPMAGVTEAEAIQAVVDVVAAGCDFEVEVSAKESAP